ncbi:DUF7373 family lipoprotein [Tsukamurella tyrosinosolvens]|uniref:DUF7373 family lipoprotein n=1 Tax=Tsukamurella tyrosinosolvens TaxID=57704 RepID=UPI002DD44BA7|nr:hypothetical protein [Tsukamurella tyrosinosolvens]MEC4611563.1 hypothetical protein [Tsukamurella tyrosinosolvens]
MLAISLTAACSQTVSGEPFAAEPALDVGSYSTAPRIITQRGGDDAAVQGNIALSDYVISPADLDPRFDEGQYTQFPSPPDRSSMVGVFGEQLASTLSLGRTLGVIDSRADDAGAVLTTIVLRYTSDTFASEVIDTVRRTAAPPPTPELASHPRAFVGPTPQGPPGTARSIWLQHNEFLILASFRGIATSAADALASAFFARQVPQLDRVPFRPLTSGIQPADRDDIRTLTRIDENDPSEVKYLAGYYSPRAWVMVSTGSWKNGIASYDRYGIDLIAAEGRNQVLRARNPGSAAGYLQEQEQPTTRRVRSAVPARPGRRRGRRQALPHDQAVRRLHRRRRRRTEQGARIRDLRHPHLTRPDRETPQGTGRQGRAPDRPRGRRHHPAGQDPRSPPRHPSRA